MSRRTTRGVATGVAARVALLGALVSAVVWTGGCTPLGSGSPSSPAATAAAPALDTGQVDRVMGALTSALRAGDRSHSASALQPRLDGAALAVRSATYTVQQHVATTPAPAALTGSVLLTGVPTAGAWPRWFLAVTRASSASVPQLLVLTQASAQAQYHLSASAALLPGTTLPALQRDAAGAVTALPAGSAGGLASSPQAVLARYAGVLSTGDTSTSAFPADAFREEVASQQAAERSGTAAYDAYTSAYAPAAGAAWAVRTQDGGALVLGVLDGTRTFTPKGPGVTQTLTPDLAALAGRSSASGGLQVSEADVVALHVPAAGSSAQPALVAGARGVTGVQLR